MPLGDVCWCLISAGDWLFCGLGSGNIKVLGPCGESDGIDLLCFRPYISSSPRHSSIKLRGGKSTVISAALTAGTTAISASSINLYYDVCLTNYDLSLDKF